MNKHLYTLLTVLLITIPTLHSCKGDESDNTEEYYEDAETSENEELPVTEEAPEYIPEDKEISFHESGRTIEDFVPSTSKYEVVRELTMDLNKDGREDIVLLLFHKNDPNASRPVLVLLKQQDNSYRLDAMSRVAMLSKYNGYINPQDFSIEKDEEDSHALKVNYSIPNGHFENTYKYQENTLVINKIYSAIIGPPKVLEKHYYPLTGEITVLITTHPDDENAPKQEDRMTFKTEPHIYTFKKDNPQEVDYNGEELPYL